MSPGDQVWMTGTVYSEMEDGPEQRKKLVMSRISCAPGFGLDPTPDSDEVQALTGINRYRNFSGSSDRLTATHNMRALFTAEQAGYHTCYIQYSCVGLGHLPQAADVTFSASSNLSYYTTLNQFPGENWQQGSDVVLDSTSTKTVELETWNAGTSTSSDSEVVAMWSPYVSACLDADGDDPGDFCYGYDTDQSGAYYKWRIVVYQINSSGQTCNKDFGAWSSTKYCGVNDHHCGVTINQETFPIVTGQGSDGNCGSSGSSKKFKVYGQMKKAYSWDNDLVVHGPSSNYSNLVIYSR